MTEEDKLDIIAATVWALAKLTANAEVEPLGALGLATVALRAVNEARARLLEEPAGRM